MDNTTTIQNNTTTAPPPVLFTESAIAELKNLLYEKDLENNPDMYLRIGVKGGGCSGLSYILGFDQKQDGDEMFEVEGIKAIMSKAHALYLLGMEVDYINGLNNRGFIFNNPNASSTCGCGSSFSA